GADLRIPAALWLDAGGAAWASPARRASTGGCRCAFGFAANEFRAGAGIGSAWLAGGRQHVVLHRAKVRAYRPAHALQAFVGADDMRSTDAGLLRPAPGADSADCKICSGALYA